MKKTRIKFFLFILLKFNLNLLVKNRKKNLITSDQQLNIFIKLKCIRIINNTEKAETIKIITKRYTQFVVSLAIKIFVLLDFKYLKSLNDEPFNSLSNVREQLLLMRLDRAG